MDHLWKACLAVLVACICCLTVTGVRQATGAISDIPPTYTGRVPDWRTYATAGHRVGPKNPDVTIVAFIDYECPFSRLLSDTLDRILHRMRPSVAVVYRNFPLSMHGHAREAAKAAECADAQGRFLEYHHLLISDYPRPIRPASWNGVALRAEVADTGAFASCLLQMNGRGVSRLTEDSVAGARLRVTGTPTLLINGNRYAGLPYDLSELVDRARRRTRVVSGEDRAMMP